MVRADPRKRRTTDMTHTIAARHRRAVQLWLFAVAALMVVTLVVGGATRLTESGLSIVEWKPVTGVLPPLSQEAWQAEFDKYKEIPQYRELNRGMRLDAFKTIYWWEWSHRLLARLVGAAFLLPFLFFLWRGWIEPRLKLRLWLLFGSGALLGAVGWWMVSSGLAGRVSVSQYRLGFHLTLACAIYAAILWTALRLSERATARAAAALAPRRHCGCCSLVLVQIYLGALVAGLDAGLDLQHLAADRRRARPVGRAAVVRDAGVAQPVRERADRAIQPPHVRLCAVACWRCCTRSMRPDRRGAACARRAGARRDHDDPGRRSASSTLLHQAPIALALLHQAMAIVVLTIAVVHARAAHAASARTHGCSSGRRRRHRRFAMIEATRQGDVMVVKLAHGKANALDIELCEAIVDALQRAARRRRTQADRPDRAGADVFRGRRSAAPDRRRRRLRAQVPAGAAPALRHGVSSSRSP